MNPDPETVFVKPAQGLTVRDPVTREALPPEGRAVPRSIYWLRRLRDGDAVETEPPASPPGPLSEGRGGDEAQSPVGAQHAAPAAEPRRKRGET